LIVGLIIQTIRRDPSRSDQIDAEHQATDLVIDHRALVVELDIAAS
jgi:hypothetical protein